MSILQNDLSPLQRDFIESNDAFIKRNAELSLQEVKRPKSRDKFIEEEIRMKSDLADNFGLTRFDDDYYRNQIKMKAREMIESKNPLLGTRQIQNEGGLLTDERENKSLGGILSRIVSKVNPKAVKVTEIEEIENFLMDKKYPEAVSFSRKELNDVKKEVGGDEEYLDFLSEFNSVKQSDIDYIIRAKEEGISSKDIQKFLKNLNRDPNAEGGEIDNQMAMLMIPKEPEEEMLPDDEMEDEYLDFILDEALDNEEEDYLMEMLQGNDRLSEIFDKVIDIAQEFAGSGPVEGPGSGVSDSIPARLSDGEFVFTAKAVEEIGADNLMAMMKDAEMKADDRQGLAEGGKPEEEETVEMEVEKPASKQDIRVVKTTVDNVGKGLLDEDEISKSIKSKMMLDNRTGRHVQS